MSAHETARFVPLIRPERTPWQQETLLAVTLDVPLSQIVTRVHAPEYGLTGARCITIDEARRLASERAISIFGDWNELKAIVGRHEGIIQKRWAKKTKERRRKLLLAAWPHMAPKHRPDFDAFYTETTDERVIEMKRESFMWPYINQEDLMRPKSLSLLLNARGRHCPDVFAYADGEAMRVGNVTRAIRSSFLIEECSMYLLGRDAANRYGVIVRSNGDDEAFEDLMAGRAKAPGDGLAILEAQQRLYRFLVDISKRLLHDMVDDGLLSEKHAVQPEPPAMQDESTGLTSLAEMAAQAPYRLPAAFDIARLQSLFAAKAAAAEDHLWNLREDLGYYADNARQVFDHDQSNLLDTSGSSHPIKGFMNGEIVRWGSAFDSLISEAYRMVEVWNELRDQVEDLAAVQASCLRQITVEKDLPGEYMAALLKFQYYVEAAARGPMTRP